MGKKEWMYKKCKIIIRVKYIYMIFPTTVLGKTLLVIGALALIIFNATSKSSKMEEVEIEDPE